MKIAIVFFTYGGDEELLRYALRGVERLKAKTSHTVDVYVYDQDDRPLSAPPDGVEYRRTTFDRGGNLNGLACVEAMAAIYAALGRSYTWIIKADSDVIIHDLDWVLAFDPSATSMVGSSYNGATHIHGSCYAVSADGAQAMEQALNNEETRAEVARRRCEDAAFTYLAGLSGLPPARYIIDERGLTYRPSLQALSYATAYKPITSCRPLRYHARDRILAAVNMRERLNR